MAIPVVDGIVSMHNHGLKLKRVYKGRPKDFIQKCMGDKWCKRGKVTTFSRFSARNLKEKLLNLPWGEGVCMYGVTLTLQADAYASVDDPVETFRRHWSSFVVIVSKMARERVLASYFSFVWRIELTLKGTPHLHCILCTNFPPDVLLFQATWVRLVRKWYGYTPHENVAAKYRRIDNCEAAFSYVGAHASKHKRDQLGWQGRQWGFICPTPFAKSFYKSQVGLDKGRIIHE